jgi:hypothetical protein
MRKWIIYWCIEYLIRHGFFVLRPEAPALIVSFGTGTFKDTPDGGRVYHVYMRPGHKLYAINQTSLVKDNDKIG